MSAGSRPRLREQQARIRPERADWATLMPQAVIEVQGRGRYKGLCRKAKNGNFKHLIDMRKIPQQDMDANRRPLGSGANFEDRRMSQMNWPLCQVKDTSLPVNSTCRHYHSILPEASKVLVKLSAIIVARPITKGRIDEDEPKPLLYPASPGSSSPE